MTQRLLCSAHEETELEITINELVLDSVNQGGINK